MWNISRQSFGFVLSFKGSIELAEMGQWVAAAKVELLNPLPTGWGVVVDMRELLPLRQDAQAMLIEGQKLFKQHGMTRSAVALKDAVTTMQFRRLARTSGIDAWERYIDTSAILQWQTAAKQWVVSGIEPGAR